METGFLFQQEHRLHFVIDATSTLLFFKDVLKSLLSFRFVSSWNLKHEGGDSNDLFHLVLFAQDSWSELRLVADKQAMADSADFSIFCPNFGESYVVKCVKGTCCFK